MNAKHLEELLVESGYDVEKTKFLVDGFTVGFPIGYAGDTRVKRTAPNLKIRVGTKIDLWNKVMKEVKKKRYAGPFGNHLLNTIFSPPYDWSPKTMAKIQG